MNENEKLNSVALCRERRGGKGSEVVAGRNKKNVAAEGWEMKGKLKQSYIRGNLLYYTWPVLTSLFSGFFKVFF